MKKLIALLILSFLASSCDEQTKLAIENIFKNLPKDYKQNLLISAHEYEKIKERTQKAALSTPQLNTGCKTPLSNIIDFNDASALEKIKDQLCSCKAWGTCDANSCSCEALCPDTFSILRSEALRDVKEIENNLSFINSSTELYPNEKLSSGYCWGFALLTQKFNTLAKFNPNKVKPFSTKTEERQRRAHYKSIIQQIINNQPAEIEGYKNLLEFSEDPEVKDMLMDFTKEEWAKNAMNWQGLSIVSSKKPLKVEEYKTVLNDIKERLNNNQKPSVVFNIQTDRFAAHTILIDNYQTPANNVIVLCAIDSNLNPENNKQCMNGLFFNATKNTLHFIHQGEVMDVAQIAIGHSENANIVEQQKNLLAECKGQRSCQ